MSIVLGVDIGATGGLVRLANGIVTNVFEMPTKLVLVGNAKRRRIDPDELAAIIRVLLPVDFAVIELVHSRPKEGVTSAFTFGRATGLVEGVLAANLIPVRVVPPVVWKRAMSLQTAEKEEARLLAIDTFPSMAPRLAKKKSHGLAEAALIALYGAHHPLAAN